MAATATASPKVSDQAEKSLFEETTSELCS
jgi:hypothetical protein